MPNFQIDKEFIEKLRHALKAELYHIVDTLVDKTLRALLEPVIPVTVKTSDKIFKVHVRFYSPGKKSNYLGRAMIYLNIGNTNRYYLLGYFSETDNNLVVFKDDTSKKPISKVMDKNDLRKIIKAMEIFAAKYGQSLIKYKKEGILSIPSSNIEIDVDSEKAKDEDISRRVLLAEVELSNILSKIEGDRIHIDKARDILQKYGLSVEDFAAHSNNFIYANNLLILKESARPKKEERKQTKKEQLSDDEIKDIVKQLLGS